MGTAIDKKSLTALEGISKRLERWLFDHMDDLTGRQFYNGGLIIDSISSFIGILSTQLNTEDTTVTTARIDTFPATEEAPAIESDDDDLELFPGETLISQRSFNVTD